ncbi:glycosyl transferase [Leptospira levettii]|uniref:glycosyl transferase n=1 Tax=Leptospira levettii TaxID=2023178 RepID=UPI000C2AC05A|nr:glycosyl transferase [Leptospira levettii]MCW7472014.1 glycosyl transferase [Leptospira levettii]PJZ90130.1 glycosyl transferase [Leptospira levettii]
MATLIFTEALISTGLGHLGRCTALAEKLLEEGETTVQMVLHSDQAATNWSFPCQVQSINWKEKKQLIEFLDGYNQRTDLSDFIFYVDSYLADLEIYNTLKDYCSELICIDDDCRIEYPADSTILNPGYPGLYLDYNTEKYKILTGKDQVLLRKPFREKFEIPKRNIPPHKILVTLGGSDPHLFSEEILSLLVKNFPALEKHLVVGPGFTNEVKLKELSDKNTFFYKNLSAIQMRDLMIQMDFAITAGGQTTYELDRCKVPMVMIKTAENQEGNIRGFVEFQKSQVVSEPKELVGILKNNFIQTSDID